ncbi:hypothetical protein ACWPMX_03330 [Tsuneonella sp. HG094]
MTDLDPQRLPAPAASAGAPAPADDTFGFVVPEYDPAEYRWVPVRRRPRHDGWTEEKQRRFIEVLADTGLVGAAAKEVGMTRASAYRLRRAAHAGAFARAWDQARERAGALIEDIAFERAIEGVEVETFDGNGELSATRTVYNDRLLTFLLRHLKPERYSAAARERRGSAWPEGQGASECAMDDALRAMEPELPAPPEELLDPDQLETDLLTAEIADGTLPRFLSEQREPRSAERLMQEELAARIERGQIADAKMQRKESLSEAECEDWCAYIDPIEAALEAKRGTKRRRPRPGRNAG